MASRGRGPGPNIGHITQTSALATPSGETLPQPAEPMDQPSACLPDDQREEEDVRELPQDTSPTVPLGEARETMEAEGAVAHMPPGWTQVHPSRPVVPVGLVPHSLGDEWHHCHSHSCHSQKRAHLQAEKNQQSGGTCDSVPWLPYSHS